MKPPMAAIGCPEESDVLTVARHMQEAVGYLAAIASRSELDKIARTLLAVHLDLAVKIETLTEIARARPQSGSRAPKAQPRVEKPTSIQGYDHERRNTRRAQ